MADVVRFQEAISSFVLDSGEAVSYRSLASQVGGDSASRAQALAQFFKQNERGVGALHVAVELNASTIKTKKPLDPRARVVRLSVASESTSQVYGVYPSALEPGKDAEETMEAMALALWAQERKVRNDLFEKISKHKPITRELKAFYQSDVHCAEATSRSDLGDIQGEEAVTVFDSIKASSNGRTQPAAPTSAAKPSFFKSSASSATASTAASSSASSAAKSNSFFKSSSTTSTTAKAKTSAAATKSKTVAVAETKRIDADAMNNVLTVDSDDDSDGEDDAPKFVKAAPAAKPRSKRVMISDDEDEDEGFEEVQAPRAKKETRPSAKRKLSESPERPAKQAKAASPKKVESPKRKRVAEEEEEEEHEPQVEEEPLPTGPIKRRELVTKTIINDMGYMVTEKVYEEVEVSVEELAKERAEAKKKQAAAKAAAAAQKARAAAAAAAASNKASKAAVGPPKQKKLDFFFARK